jgi:uncharacterized protein YlaN (UPF0358 family)
MSKLSENIRAVQLNQRVAYSMPLTVIDTSIDNLTFSSCKCYNITATIGMKTYIDFEDNLDSVITNVRKAVVQEIFGEFREPLKNLSIALYNRDLPQAHKIIDEIHQQMFE